MGQGVVALANDDVDIRCEDWLKSSGAGWVGGHIPAQAL